MKRIIATSLVVCGFALAGCTTTAKRTEKKVASEVTVPTTTPTTTTIPEPTTTTVRPHPHMPPTSVEPEPVQAVEVPAGDGTVSLDDPDMPAWRAIALCEMPGPGGVPSEPWGAHWGFRATWSGAFGIYNQTWLGAGGGKYGPTAGHATWQQQIEIARVIRDRYGYRAWGCGRKLGL